MKVLFSRKGKAKAVSRACASAGVLLRAKWGLRTWCLAFALQFLCGNAYAQIAFENQTGKALDGISSETWGGSWGDYNGDYWPDVLIPNHRDRPAFYRNNGDGTFTNVILQTDMSHGWLSNRYADHHGAAFADFDGDGDDDVFTVTNGCCPSQFMVSNGSVFKEQGTYRGLKNLDGSSTAWLDWNRDGRLDVLANAKMRIQDASGRFMRASERLCDAFWLHLSDVNGDGVQDVLCGRDGTYPTAIWDLSKSPPRKLESRFPKVSNVVDATSADLNNDLKPDYIFVRGTTLNNDARLTSNRSIEASFDNSPTQTRQAGMPGFTFVGGGVVTMTFNRPTGGGFAVRVGRNGRQYPFSNRLQIKLDPNDLANHGFRSVRGTNDVFVGYDPASRQWRVQMGEGKKWWMFYLQIDSASRMSEVKVTGLRAVDRGIRPQIYHHKGQRFLNRTFESGLARDNLKCNSVVAEDFDNDMDVDLFFACTGGVINTRNRVFANDGTGKFTEVAGGAGAAGITGSAIGANAGSSESAITADYDNDGFVDVFVTNGINTQPTRVGGPHQIFRNRGNGNNWVSVELKGTRSNPAGIGATIYATSGGVTQLRQYNGGYHRWSQNYKRAHFGLARNTLVQFRVIWPNGDVEDFDRVAANRLYVITEGQGIKPVFPAKVRSLPAARQGEQCGKPKYDPGLDRGIFIHKDCGSGMWRVRVASGGSTGTRSFTGDLSSNKVFANVRPHNAEVGDQYQFKNRKLTFTMATSGTGVDGLDFKIGNNADLCLTLGGRIRGPVYLGSKNRRIYPPVDLNSLQGCAGASVRTLAVKAVTVKERNRSATVVITLSGVATKDVTVKFSTTTGGTAKQGKDYYGVSQTVRIKAGEKSATAKVQILDDRRREQTETIRVKIFNPVHATLAKANATITIVDND